ncbi:MAG: DUF4256 domain-containing protein [Selenomonadales bacterium]|nr:DUF4256 domain-containing protein [Selenomonadales bacterium]
MSSQEIMDVLRARFAANAKRHLGIKWEQVQARLDANPMKLGSLREMESTGGEPDVIGCDPQTGAVIFCDCSPETPLGRRNSCYDRAGQAEREKKGIFPSGNAVDMAAAMGIELLTEEAYHELQRLGSFDTKTSSWLKTPAEVRKLGGAIFGDRRFGRVFIYHNGAASFYSVRGFRGSLRV